MAIIDAVSGLEATILIDGQVAPEYDDPEPLLSDVSDNAKALNFCSKYIESRDGATFGVRVKTTKDFPRPTRAHVAEAIAIVDGKFTQGNLVDCDQNGGSVDIRGVKVPQGRFRKLHLFTFAGLKFCEC